MNKEFRAPLAELVGTFCFVFIGAGSIVSDVFTHGSIGLIGIAIAHGLALSVMVSATMSISGGQLNPAVSIALWANRLQSARATLLNIAAQLLGASLAAYILKSLYAPEVWQGVKLGTPALTAGLNGLTGLGIEAVLTFALMIAIMGTAVDSKAPKIGGFGIGLIVAADIFVGGPLTGASMNPARSFGPALAAGFWDYHWLYWVGPTLGATTAAWIYKRLISPTA
jgi:MIP family channel proteins